MPSRSRSTTQSKSRTTKKEAVPIQLNSYVKDEISRLSEQHGLTSQFLEEFALFVIENHKKKEPKPAKIKPLTLAQLKDVIYKHFHVKSTPELKNSGSFKMAIDGMDSLNLAKKEGWEILYRKFIGILPGEENQQGYGCINGINIFNYFRPWQVFGLDPSVATPQDIKIAYRDLSKIYHPDNSETGDPKIFDAITIMYKSISAEA
ncbi:J domain-containing protein [Phormidium sp. FACHB-1136]|uniref:J domain-containing protein n=1 Tax=Phormidium sp. FACHB-1136 TaxID=2692848 RepID=UPI0018F04D3E|nr:J domain-containing protein [Phormidium sp. FACHB-1136]